MKVDPKTLRYGALVSGAVTTKAALIFAGYWVGNKLDAKWGTAPFLMLTGICLGLFAGLWYLMQVLNRLKNL